MSSKSMSLAIAVIAVGVALPATALAAPVGAGAPATAERSQTPPPSDAVTATSPPHGATYTAQSQDRTPQGALPPFSDAVVSADVTGALASRTPTELGQQSPIAASSTTAASDSGFDWGDAGIGAAAMLALAGIAAGGYMQLRGRGRRPALHPSGS
jgi:uncharacterized iron-regulated membrane protein